MRKNLEVIKWMAGLARPFILPFTVIIFLEAILSLCGVGMAILSKNLIDSATGGQSQRMIWIIIIYGIIILLQIGFQIILSPLSAKTQERMSNNLRQRAFAHIMRSEWRDFSKYHSGDVLTRMTRDIGMMMNILTSVIPSIVSLGVGLLAAFITMYFYEPVLAVLGFVLGPAAVLFSRVFGRKIKKFHNQMQETEGSYRSFMGESIQNLLIVKSFCLEERNVKRIDNLQGEMVDLVFKRSRLSAATNSVLGLGYWIGYFLAFGFGILKLSQGTASFGTLTAFLQLVGQIQGPFIGLAYTYPRLVSAMASAGRLMELEEMGLEELSVEAPNWSSAGIKFENVSFSYDDEKTVLEDVSFEIPEGETVALMGPSGDGKTTIIRLILSFIKPQGGRVSFTNSSGVEIEAGASSRSLISYVPQGNTLFSGTIEENLRMGSPEATEEELREALQGACALEFVEGLSGGLNTVIGEKGLGLSEGQAQRLSIARALLRKAPILILDEATSSLDMETEKKVLRTIGELKPSPTCVVITHRATALEICSRVFKIKNGQLLEYASGAIEAAASEEA
jgi:ATP-binding cassette, subfamily B, bacterial